MTLAYLIDLKMIGKNQKVEIRNITNSISCEGFIVNGGLSNDNPIFTDNKWGVPILMWQVSHIYTQDDIICVSLIDPRGELRNIKQKETEFIKRIKNFKGVNLYV